MRMTSPGSIFVAAVSRMSLSAAVTRSRRKMSISSRRSRLASFSGVEGSILMMTVHVRLSLVSDQNGFNLLSLRCLIALPMLMLRGLQLFRNSICGLR